MTAYREFAVGLAKEVGGIMKEYFLKAERSRKGDNTFITVADETINQLVIDEVKKQYPDHGVLAEEGSHALEKPDLWVCDPIDGTMPFVCGIPCAVFSLALVKDGVPILGVVYDPFLYRMWYAEKGKGATLNEKPITVSACDIVKKSTVGFIFWHGKVDLSAPVQTLVDQAAHVVNTGSSVNMGVLVATGLLEAVLLPAQRPWDLAAQKIIVEEAGGKVTDLSGKEQRYDKDINGAIVSNGKLHEKLLEILNK